MEGSEEWRVNEYDVGREEDTLSVERVLNGFGKGEGL
jgi:hypothetical protein